MALLASAGCRTPSYGELQWDDVTGQKRDHAALDADYERCRVVRGQAFLNREGGSYIAPDVAGQASSDTAFLSCMERSGWKPRRAST
ncbi:MAG TPA: hypothetical protein VNT02_02000 [Burkholderiales bacterium]|nr:hypothetical protein [Burkholderiales bacterium]